MTDKQVRDLRITSTPHHPETELRRLEADFVAPTNSEIRLQAGGADGNLVTGQNQNAAPMVARNHAATN